MLLFIFSTDNSLLNMFSILLFIYLFHSDKLTIEFKKYAFQIMLATLNFHTIAVKFCILKFKILEPVCIKVFIGNTLSVLITLKLKTNIWQ